MPSSITMSWRTIALVAVLPIILIAVLAALLLRGDPQERCAAIEDEAKAASCWIRLAMETKDFTLCNKIANEGYRKLCSHDAVYEGDAISSSTSTFSVAAADSSIATIAEDMSFEGPIAPFDACLGIAAYESQPWYPALNDAMYQQGIFDDFTEACLSSDYMIGISRQNSLNKYVLRFDVRTQTLQRAKHQGGERNPATSFGKRNGDLIPLMLGSCRSGTYNLRTNIVVADGSDCVTAACSALPKLGEGWPRSPQYEHLQNLGAIFTADDCGGDRMASVVPHGFITEGSAIFLDAPASTAFATELSAIGYTCEGDCLKWENWSRSIPVSDILRLKPFVGEMAGDDCRYCG